MKVNVVVGRFQIDRPHDGHLYFFDKVKDCDKLLLFLGSPIFTFSKKNPLTFEQREVMMQEVLYNANIHQYEILSIIDNQSNQMWSNNLDKMIEENTNPDDEIVLCYCRDGFGKRYAGRYTLKEIPAPEHIVGESATKRRSDIVNYPLLDSADFRAGTIYAIQHAYPHARAVADIALVNKTDGTALLGKRPNGDKWQFIGGFVDPTDKNIETTAARELLEETGLVSNGVYTYLCSMSVPDWRLRDVSEYSMMSSFFLTEYAGGEAKAADDIGHVNWFKIDEILDLVIPPHKPLAERLIEYVKNGK